MLAEGGGASGLACRSKLLAARTWDLVVVLVVGQTAGHQEGGWSTGYLFVLQVFI